MGKILNSKVLFNKKYSHEKAALLMECSDMAYDRPKPFRKSTPERFYEIGFSDKNFNPKTYGPNSYEKGHKFIEDKEVDFQAWIAWNKEQIILTIRGSKTNEKWKKEDNKDWYYNFRFGMTKTKYGNLHKGFYTIVSKVYPLIINEITSIPNYKSKDLYITGHSQGACTATLFLYMLLKNNDHKKYELYVDDCYVYGLARWTDGKGCKDFWKLCKKNNVIYRWFRNNNDIVTRIPPCVWGYRHSKGYMYITSLGKVKSGTTWWQDLFDGWFGRAIDIFDLDLDIIDDHYPSNYANHLFKTSGSEKRLSKFDV